MRKEVDGGRLRSFVVNGEIRVTETALLELMGEVAAVDLLRGREVMMPLREPAEATSFARVLTEQLSWGRSGPFSYSWPKRRDEPENTEHFRQGHATCIEVGGKRVKLQIGFTKRGAAGMEDRERAVVFLVQNALIPLVEFAGANDFQETGLMASVVKLAPVGGRGGKHLRPEMPVPEEYSVAGLRLDVYSNVVQGPYAAGSVAVVAASNELGVMAYHGLVRARWKGWV